MKKVQESAKKETRIMDSFIKKAWLFVIAALIFPAMSFAQTQDKTRTDRQDTSKTRTNTKESKYQKSTRTDTSRTYRYDQQNQNMNQQNQNQNQQNRNRYDNQRGDTLQKNKDAVLIENEPRK